MINYVKIALVIAAGCWLSVQQVFGQEANPVYFFPYQTGDFWIYQTYSEAKQEVTDEIKHTVYADSTDSTGARWVYVKINSNDERIDSVYVNIRPNGDIYSDQFCLWDYCESLLVLKHSVIDWESFWIGGKAGGENYIRFDLLDRREDVVYGQSREHRVVGYSTTSDTTDPHSGLQSFSSTWVEGFGIMREYAFEGGGSTFVKGVVKDGTAYGDTAFAPVVVDTLREDFFPYRSGDFWVYNVYQSSIGEVQYEVKYRVYDDSTDAEGTRWVYVEKNVNGAVDTVYYKVTKDGDIYSDDVVGTEMLKFTAHGVSRDDYWVGGELSDGNYGVYELAFFGIYDMVGTPQLVSESRRIDFYTTKDTTINFACCGSRRSYERWAAGFGPYVIKYDINSDTVWSIKSAYKNGQVYGDTTFTVITSNEIKQEIPSAFKLHQNYPNPFNPSTEIAFELYNSGNVSLIVYDLLGREIDRLIDNQLLPTGLHQRSWQPEEGISSGVYIYQVTAGEQIKTRKMTLIK